MTKPQLRVALQECRQSYHDYQFTAEQKIQDLQGQVKILLAIDERFKKSKRQ